MLVSEVRTIKFTRSAPSYRPTGPRCARPEDKLRPVSMIQMDPGLRRGDENEDEANLRTSTLAGRLKEPVLF